MGEWKDGKLIDIAEIIMGQSPSGETCNTISEGLPLLNGPTEFGIKNPLAVQFTTDAKRISLQKDVLFCVRGSTTGRMNWADKKYAIGRGLAALRHRNGNQYSFFLKGIIEYNLPLLLQSSTGSTFPNVSKNQLERLEIQIPPLPEQKAIASVLSSLDDKIDLLHRQNKTLEQMAETLFRQWFVEEVKEDWEEGVLSDILSVKGGTTPSTKNPEFWDGEIHWTTPRDLSNSSNLYLLDTLRKITKKGLEKIGSGLLPKGTLILSSRAPVGYLAFSEIPIAINQGYIAIIDNKNISKLWIYLWLKENMDYIKSHANGSTFQEISKTSFNALIVNIPPKEIRVDFDNIVTPSFEKIKENTYQIHTLEKLRDTLLSKLMNGEVRVKTDE